MVRSNTNRPRSFIPRLEYLEERLAPAAPPTPVLVPAYPNALYNSPYTPTQLPGIYRQSAPFIVVATNAQREVVLDPLTASPAPTDNFKNTLAGAFGNPWGFTYAANPPPGLQLTVKTYMAAANSSQGMVAPPGMPRSAFGMAGAIIDVTSNYVRGFGETVG